MTVSLAIAIVNLHSAGGATERQWPQLARKLQEAGLAVEPRFTGGPGHAAELTRSALKDGAPRILVVGGDGTINEVINGFFEGDDPLATDAAIGLLCRGTGCDLVRTLGIPRDDDAAVRLLVTGQPRPIDVGRVRFVNRQGKAEIRYFANIAEAGLGGAVVKRVNAGSKALGGTATFLLASLASFATYRNAPAEIVIDGSYVRNVQLCNAVIANGRYFGGGMKIVPDADPADGQLDVLLMGDLSRVELFANIARVYRGTHVGHPKVERFSARTVRITSPIPLPLDLDGEAAGTTPAEFEMVPGAISLIC